MYRCVESSFAFPSKKTSASPGPDSRVVDLVFRELTELEQLHSNGICNPSVIFNFSCPKTQTIRFVRHWQTCCPSYLVPPATLLALRCWVTSGTCLLQIDDTSATCTISGCCSHRLYALPRVVCAVPWVYTFFSWNATTSQTINQNDDIQVGWPPLLPFGYFPSLNFLTWYPIRESQVWHTRLNLFPNWLVEYPVHLPHQTMLLPSSWTRMCPPWWHGRFRCLRKWNASKHPWVLACFHLPFSTQLRPTCCSFIKKGAWLQCANHVAPLSAWRRARQKIFIWKLHRTQNRGVVEAIQRLNRQAHNPHDRSDSLLRRKDGKKTHGFHQNVFAPSDGACTSLPSHSTLHNRSPSLIARQLENCNRWLVSGERTTRFLAQHHPYRRSDVYFHAVVTELYMSKNCPPCAESAPGQPPWSTELGPNHREAEKSGEVDKMVTLPPILRFLDEKMKNKSKKQKHEKNPKMIKVKNWKNQNQKMKESKKEKKSLQRNPATAQKMIFWKKCSKKSWSKWGQKKKGTLDPKGRNPPFRRLTLFLDVFRTCLHLLSGRTDGTNSVLIWLTSKYLSQNWRRRMRRACEYVLKWSWAVTTSCKANTPSKKRTYNILTWLSGRRQTTSKWKRAKKAKLAISSTYFIWFFCSYLFSVFFVSAALFLVVWFLCARWSVKLSFGTSAERHGEEAAPTPSSVHPAVGSHLRNDSHDPQGQSRTPSTKRRPKGVGKRPTSGSCLMSGASGSLRPQNR